MWLVANSDTAGDDYIYRQGSTSAGSCRIGWQGTLNTQSASIVLAARLQAVMSRAVPAQQIQQLLDMLLQRDLQPLLQQQQRVQLGNEGQQFVIGRALWVGSKLCQVATAQQREAFLQAAASAGEH